MFKGIYKRKLKLKEKEFNHYYNLMRKNRCVLFARDGLVDKVRELHSDVVKLRKKVK